MYYEYIILSRGGQGGVTASRILATAAVLEGKWAQAIPEFGAERRGAIVKSYLRVSNGFIKRHSKVRNPNGMAIFSRRILDLIDIDDLIPENIKVVVNSPRRPDLESREVYYVDATGIAVKRGLVIAGWPVVNTAMAAAMAKVFGIASLASVKKAIGEYFTGTILEKNISAAETAWENVRR